MNADVEGPEDGVAEVRWAPPVRQDRLRRLYEADARGIADETLTDDIGLALYLRCRSIVTVMEAAAGRVACPRCARAGRESVIRRAGKGLSPAGKAEVLGCPACGWQTTWGSTGRPTGTGSSTGRAAWRRSAPSSRTSTGRAPSARS